MLNEQTQVAVEAAVNKKSKNLKVYDLRGKSDICDYQIICSGDNIRHTAAIAAEIKKHQQETLGKKPHHTEGLNSCQWVVLDYGSLIVHIFVEEIRSYYALDSLWQKEAVETSLPKED